MIGSEDYYFRLLAIAIPESFKVLWEFVPVVVAVDPIFISGSRTRSFNLDFFVNFVLL